MSKFFDNANNDGFVNQSDPENVEIDVLKKAEDQIREALEKSYTKDKLNKQKKFNAVCLRKLSNTKPEHEGLVRIKARVPVIHSLLPVPKDIDDYETIDLYPTFIALKSSFNPHPADSTNAVPPGTAMVVQFDNNSNFANPEILEISVIKSEEQLMAEGLNSSTTTTSGRGAGEGKLRKKFIKDVVATVNIKAQWKFEPGYLSKETMTQVKKTKKAIPKMKKEKGYPFWGVPGLPIMDAIRDLTPDTPKQYPQMKYPNTPESYLKWVNYMIANSISSTDWTAGSGDTKRVLNSRIFTYKGDWYTIHGDDSKPSPKGIDSSAGFWWKNMKPVGEKKDSSGKKYDVYPIGRMAEDYSSFEWNAFDLTKKQEGSDGRPSIILAKDSGIGFYVRKDYGMAENLEKAINEVRGKGGLFNCDSGRVPALTLRKDLSGVPIDPWTNRFPALWDNASGREVAGTRSTTKTFYPFKDNLDPSMSAADKKAFYKDVDPFSLHNTGHALDFSTSCAMSFPETDPYICEFDRMNPKVPERIQWKVYYRAPGAPVQKIQAVCLAGLKKTYVRGKGGWKFEYPSPTTHDGHVIPHIKTVRVPAYSLTDVLHNHGFERISAKAPPKNKVQELLYHDKLGRPQSKDIIFGPKGTKLPWSKYGIDPKFATDGQPISFVNACLWNSSYKAGEMLMGGEPTFFAIKGLRKWAEWWHFDYVQGIKDALKDNPNYNYYDALTGYYSGKALAGFSTDFLAYAKMTKAYKSGHGFTL